MVLLAWFTVPAGRESSVVLEMVRVDRAAAATLVYHDVAGEWFEPEGDGGAAWFEFSAGDARGGPLGVPSFRDSGVILRRPVAASDRGLLGEVLEPAFGGDLFPAERSTLFGDAGGGEGWLADDVRRLGEARDLLGGSTPDRLLPRAGRSDRLLDPYSGSGSSSLFGGE